MERVLLDAVIETDYGQFDLGWGDDFGFDGDADKYFAGQVNGLVGAAHPGGVYLHFGRRSGGSRVRIVLCTADPGPAAESWEDVVDEPVDVYLLQFWPADGSPDAILRVGSQDAEYWHREWGSRRSLGFGYG